MLAVVITTKSGDSIKIYQKSSSIAEVEIQILKILGGNKKYSRFVDVDGSIYEVKREEVESFAIVDEENGQPYESIDLGGANDK